MLPKKSFLMILALLAVALACGPVGASAPTSPVEAESIATIVAATLTALAGDAATPAPPSTPSPTATVELTATAAPRLRIAYTSGGEVWLLEESAPPRQITNTGGIQTVVISDDGRRLAYLRRDSLDAPAELRAVDNDGSDDISLLNPSMTNSLHPLDGFLRIEPSEFGFIPSTHNLIFNTRAIAEGPGLLKFNDLYELDADTGQLSLTLPAEQGGDFSMSPDGSRVAIVRPDSISMANIDGTGLRPDLVTFDPVLTYSEYQYYPLVMWSADSSAAGVVIPSSEPLGPDPSASVWRIPAHTGSAVRLSTIPGEFFFFGMGPHPLLAPDLGRVAFARTTTTPDVYQLILAGADGSDEVVYDTGRFFWQGWGPDSRRFLYGLGLPTSLKLGEVGGAGSFAGEGTDVRWLGPNEYLFLAGSSGRWELRRATVGGAVTTLVTSSAEFFAYDFSR